MNRIHRAFDELRAAGRKTLLPYITAGYPDAATTVEILRRIPADQCACVELGIPFSDPIADGPVIQTSFSGALERGFRLDNLLETLSNARAEIPVGLLAMVSYSIVYRRGPAAFVQCVRDAGIDGLIVPDLAIEEAEELAAIARDHECPLIMIIAPTSDEQRRGRIAALSEPFIYYQSLAGVTGERNALPPDLQTHVDELRHQTGKPICVGFGISTPQHVQTVCRIADGAIVGSAIVRRMNEGVEQGMPATEIADSVERVIRDLAGGLPA